MIAIDQDLRAPDLQPAIGRMWERSAEKVLALEAGWDPADGSPVFTVQGRYTARGWTDWTQGFQFGSALLQFDGTDERRFLELGRERTFTRMATHVTHMGVTTTASTTSVPGGRSAVSAGKGATSPRAGSRSCASWR